MKTYEIVYRDGIRQTVKADGCRVWKRSRLFVFWVRLWYVLEKNTMAIPVDAVKSLVVEDRTR